MARKAAAVAKKAAGKVNSKVSLHNLYDEYNGHLRTIEFYRVECKFLIKRLEEVAKANTDKEIQSRVDQLENQFIIIRENMDMMRTDITAMLKVIERMIKAKPEHSEEKSVKLNVKYRMQVHVMEKHFASFKLRLNKFIGKNL